MLLFIEEGKISKEWQHRKYSCITAMMTMTDGKYYKWYAALMDVYDSGDGSCRAVLSKGFDLDFEIRYDELRHDFRQPAGMRKVMVLARKENGANDLCEIWTANPITMTMYPILDTAIYPYSGGRFSPR